MDESAFAELLIQEKVVRPETLRRVRDTQSLMNCSLETALLDVNAVSELKLLELMGRFHSARTVGPAELGSIDPEVARLISPRMARRFEVVPFRREGQKLSVAMLNPGDLLVEDELALLTGCMVTSFVALEVRLYEAMAELYKVDLPFQLMNIAKRLTAEPAEPAPTVTSQPAPTLPEVGLPQAEPSQAAASAEEAAPAQAPRRPLMPAELEISEEDLAQFPSLREQVEEAPEPAQPVVAPPPGPPRPAVALPSDPEQRLVVISTALQDAEMREDIGDSLLDYCAPFLKRRMLLVRRGETVVGWRGEGEGVDQTAVRAVSIPLDEPSIFVNLIGGVDFWLGPLPPMPRNIDLVLALGSGDPKDCIILPVPVRSKIVCFLYGDNLQEGVAGAPMAHMRRLVGKASLAFQVYLLKNKIRML
jgi:hypothetical protein